jgi:hypothetical protein
MERMMPDPELDAMQSVFDVLDPLEPEARSRVMSWVANRLDIQGAPKAKVAKEEDKKEKEKQIDKDFNTFADLYHAASPSSNSEKALVAGYWLQVHKGTDEFGSQSVNKELQNLGHQIANVTEAFNQLKTKKPALAIQVKKSGKSQQARKTYKLTHTGVTKVESMLQAEGG